MAHNTGEKRYGLLKERIVGTGEFTGRTRTNDPSDPFYVPPTTDYTFCPVTPLAWRVKADSAYCLTRPVGWRAKSSSAYCVVRELGWRILPASAYCFTVEAGWRVKESTAYCEQREVGWRAKADTAYCLDRAVAWRAKQDTAYCFTRNVAWRAKDSTAYCLQEEVVNPAIINYQLGEQITPYVDADLHIQDNGTPVVDQTSNGSGTITMAPGHTLFSNVVSPAASTETNPSVRLIVKKDGAVIYDNSTPATAGASTNFGIAVIAGSTYDVIASSRADFTEAPLADFDYLVPQYTWSPANGRDLDTFTGFVGTGTVYDSDWVGYGQGDIAVPTATATDPNDLTAAYLVWASDNTGDSGPETILVNLKKFIQDNPSTPNVIQIKMNAVWYGRRGQNPSDPTALTGNYNNEGAGDMIVGFRTYKGGTMSLDTASHNFVNTGGVLKDVVSATHQVATYAQGASIAVSTPVAIISYDKTTQTATLTLQ
jgi:hypothetical protein